MLQELEPSAAEQLLTMWNKPLMPPQPTRSVAAMHGFVPGHYLPAEYATAPFNRPRPPHHQYPGGWPQPMNQWAMMGQRHGYPGYQQDFAVAQQHLQSQYGYSQMTKNYPGGGIYPASAARHQPGGSNPSVMIMQRSDSANTK